QHRRRVEDGDVVLETTINLQPCLGDTAKLGKTVGNQLSHHASPRTLAKTSRNQASANSSSALYVRTGPPSSALCSSPRRLGLVPRVDCQLGRAYTTVMTHQPPSRMRDKQTQ